VRGGHWFSLKWVINSLRYSRWLLTSWIPSPLTVIFESPTLFKLELFAPREFYYASDPDGIFVFQMAVLFLIPSDLA